ncbi:type 1 glutamine amidotransferase [bacterium]|nr:type 1 glutamine amidotransferase [bacterium]
MIYVISHSPVATLGYFEDVLVKKGLPFTYVRIYQGDPLPDPLQSDDVLILLAGQSAAVEKFAPKWVNDEITYVAAAVAKGNAVLGVSLGAQILARALGAPVTPSRTPEVGCSPMTLTVQGLNDPIFQGFEREFLVFQWHLDTFEIPRDAHRLARGVLVANQAFRFGEKAYGMQFHLEATIEMVQKWFKVRPEDLELPGVNPPDLMIATLEAHGPTVEENAKRLMKNFLKIAGLG